ncbi:unnamed protein product [Moneuplotes crassus]|uniref:Uncharacterized protein n=1 Tax=Euplotes crassus TaxID=5936 RepID=A0AAD1TZ27_EUPCR|nr:unnamed protein product [Moneuplotes crassus]
MAENIMFCTDLGDNELADLYEGNVFARDTFNISSQELNQDKVDLNLLEKNGFDKNIDSFSPSYDFGLSPTCNFEKVENNDEKECEKIFQITNEKKDTWQKKETTLGDQDISISLKNHPLLNSALEQENLQKIASLRTLTSNLSEQNQRMKDLIKKSSLQQFRKFYEETFRIQNIDIIKRRYASCSFTKIFQQMRLILQEMISAEYLTDELVLYTIGITRLQKLYRLLCSVDLKQEITDFINLASKFSERRFQKCLESQSFQTLLDYFLMNSVDPEIRAMQLGVKLD